MTHRKPCKNSRPAAPSCYAMRSGYGLRHRLWYCYDVSPRSPHDLFAQLLGALLQLQVLMEIDSSQENSLLKVFPAFKGSHNSGTDQHRDIEALLSHFPCRDSEMPSPGPGLPGESMEDLFGNEYQFYFLICLILLYFLPFYGCILIPRGFLVCFSGNPACDPTSFLWK